MKLATIGLNKPHGKIEIAGALYRGTILKPQILLSDRFFKKEN